MLLTERNQSVGNELGEVAEHFVDYSASSSTSMDKANGVQYQFKNWQTNQVELCQSFRSQTNTKGLFNIIIYLKIFTKSHTNY